MSDHARTERRQLADLLLAAGPDQPTLCTGWTTRDLAAHLVVRERRPDAMVAGLIPGLAAHGESVRAAKAALDYPALVAEVRDPPWWSPVSNRLTDELANTLEFFIHHEDVRRARPGWQPRSLPVDEQRAIWQATRLTARLSLRKLRMPVLLSPTGFADLAIGTADARPPRVTLRGEPGELALFVSGRQQAARVETEGAQDAVDALREARLGM